MANMGWNYPPGVTGNEYEIAGPDKEWEEEFYCEECDKDIIFHCESFQKQRSGICGECDSAIDIGSTDDDIDWEGIAEQKADLDNHRIEMGWD